MLYNLGKNNSVPDNVDIVLDCTSHNSDSEIAHDLSPFYLGPYRINGETAENFENAWQYSKLYEQFLRNGVIQDSYYSWRSRGYASKKAIRYPMQKGAIPVCSLLNDNRLTYVQARRAIYLPGYGSLVRQTKTFKRLRREVKQGASIAFRDFDGYNHHKLGYSWHDVIEDPTRKMGHGFVLCMLLEMPSLLKMYNL